MIKYASNFSFDIDYWKKDKDIKIELCIDLKDTKNRSKIIGIKYDADIIYFNIIKSYSIKDDIKDDDKQNIVTGNYNYILSIEDDNIYLNLAERNILEIGGKHFCILRSLFDRKENDNKDIKILSAGEMTINNNYVKYNFLSGTIMKDIDRFHTTNMNKDIDDIRKNILIPLHTDILSSIFTYKNIEYINSQIIDKEITLKDIDELCEIEYFKDKNRIFQYKKSKDCKKSFNNSVKHKKYC